MATDAVQDGKSVAGRGEVVQAALIDEVAPKRVATYDAGSFGAVKILVHLNTENEDGEEVFEAKNIRDALREFDDYGIPNYDHIEIIAQKPDGRMARLYLGHPDDKDTSAVYFQVWVDKADLTAQMDQEQREWHKRLNERREFINKMQTLPHNQIADVMAFVQESAKAKKA